ncbi:hypothetical protein PVAP13_4NG097500 [Panicum virgatum]|uniref:Uncharacterized protein n=1 Tax=Panicum virgatum TaxID=38727 RepID=A0A8T0TAQ3_PANVG|nr:hypothetical protein PVAP13_4NG097500 [Panicum virgatum]
MTGSKVLPWLLLLAVLSGSWTIAVIIPAAARGGRRTVGRRPAGACRRRCRRLGHRAAAVSLRRPWHKLPGANGDEAGWTLVRDVEPHQQRLSKATTTNALKMGWCDDSSSREDAVCSGSRTGIPGYI